MSYLLPCPSSSELRAVSMDVQQAPSRSLRHRPPFLLCSPWFLSPYVFWHFPMQNASRSSLCAGNCTSVRRSPVMFARKGNPIAFEGLCEVVWTVEADLADGQLLYITGEPVVLGCWKPEMAILMVPTEHSKLWQAEIKIAHGINCKYNYFIKEESWPSDIFWRPGPAFSLSVPLTSKQDRKIVVRDSWMTCNTERSLSHRWGSWMEDTFFPIQSLIPAPGRDKDESVMGKSSEYEDTDNATHEDESLKLVVNGLLETKYVLNGHEVKEKFPVNRDTENVTHGPPVSGVTHSMRDQPIEEPWYAQPCFSTVTRDKIESDVHNQHYQGTDKLLPEAGSNIISKDDSASTTILINSSLCTLQRIAILEDDKLVELLLEPVKSSVQCGSVYLGVFVKHLPKLGGAFINIGGTRNCLMQIHQNKEPFIFPPFNGKKKEKDLNGSVIGPMKKHPVRQDNEGTLEDDVEDHIEIDSQDPVQMVSGDYEELECLKENMSADITDYAEVEADLEDDLDGIEHRVEGESVKDPVTTEPLNYSLVPFLQRLKESRHVYSEEKWDAVQKGTKIIVQVYKEGLGTKGPVVTPYPKLKSRFWVLHTRDDRIGVSSKIAGVERACLKRVAKSLQPPGCGLTVRSLAAGRSQDELKKDLLGLLSTWTNILEQAKSSALAADEGEKGAVPIILHRAMGQIHSVVQEYFSEKVKRLVVDSQRTYHKVTNYLQDMAPDLCDRVELHTKGIPLFDQFNIEEEFNNLLSKRVALPNGGSLVIEQTEALVSIDVNGGHGMFGGGSQQGANLKVNLAAAKQVAREIRLRDIGGIIVVDFIDMDDEANRRLVYEEVKNAVKRDRSVVDVSELSRHGLMEITRKRVRPSVTFMISEPCPCCHATGRVEALETSFSKIEQQIYRSLAKMKKEVNPQNHNTWPKFTLWVDKEMCDYLTSGKRTRLQLLSGSLKVWILLKVARGFTRGAFELKPFTDEDNSQPLKKVALFPTKKGKAVKKQNARPTS